MYKRIKAGFSNLTLLTFLGWIFFVLERRVRPCALWNVSSILVSTYLMLVALVPLILMTKYDSRHYRCPWEAINILS